MKQVYFILLTLNILFMLSCKAQNKDVELELKECVNEKVNNNILEAYGKSRFDFYQLIIGFEEIMIEQGYLKNNNKGSYKQLLLRVIEGNSNLNELYNQLDSASEEVGFGYKIYTISNSILVKCPYEAFFKDKKTDHPFIKEYIIKINKLEAKSYEDKKLIVELLDVFDEDSFNNIAYRAPIILLVMINLDNQFNPHLKKIKERQKGKDFLKKN